MGGIVILDSIGWFYPTSQAVYMTATEEADAVRRHTKWVYKIANEYAAKWRHVDVDDLIQEGLLGLVIAIRKWRPDGGASLITFATYEIRARMRELIGVDSGHRLIGEVRTSSLDEPIATGEGSSNEDDYALIDVLGSQEPSPETVCANNEAATLARKALHKLSAREQCIIRLRFVEELTLDEVTEHVNVKRSRIDQIEKEAVASLKEAFRAA